MLGEDGSEWKGVHYDSVACGLSVRIYICWRRSKRQYRIADTQNVELNSSNESAAK
jgi:hypothetical protein